MYFDQEKRYVTLEGPCIIFAIYIQSNKIQNVVALIKFLLVLRCQLYTFRTVTVQPQERYSPKHVELTPKY